MNNFILNTINHLNKISVKGDEKLQEFDEKLNDLEIMTTLLESKLNSLPANITSTYPEIQQVYLLVLQKSRFRSSYHLILFHYIYQVIKSVKISLHIIHLLHQHLKNILKKK